MKTLILPVDFSPISDNAMRFGVDLALNIHADVLLLHVYMLPVGVNEVPVTMINADDMRIASESRLAELKEELEKITASEINIDTQARMGLVIDELKACCDEVKPFAVVMGTHGAGKLERALFGSNTLSAIRHLQTPVLIVPPGASFKGVKKMGLAWDFREISSSIPEEIAKIVREFNAELHLLHVDHLHKMGKLETPDHSHIINNKIADLHPQFHLIEKEHVEEGLSELAETNNIDILMVIPRKHTFLEGLFHKSHSKELAIRSHIPVMSIHE